MTKYELKNPALDAVQWLKDGDHNAVTMIDLAEIGDGIGDDRVCSKCGQFIKNHGKFYDSVIDRVCPGNWIIWDPIANKYVKKEQTLFELAFKPLNS